MKEEEWLDEGYPCLDGETAAEDHGVHPFYDAPSWHAGFQRGYAEGRLDGERLTAKALRADLRAHLQAWAGDVRVGLRHDLETPLDVLHWVEWLVEDLTACK